MRPKMFGVEKPREFLQMLRAIDAFLEVRPDSLFYPVWWEYLAADIPAEQYNSCVEDMQDDWFRARGLPEDDPILVQPVRQHRATWVGRRLDGWPSHVSKSLQEVQIRIDTKFTAHGTCMDCTAPMASELQNGMIWFWCPICDEGVFLLEQNFRRDAIRASLDPSFRILTWKAKADELPLEPPEFRFE